MEEDVGRRLSRGREDPVLEPSFFSLLDLLEPQLTLWSPKTSILSCFAAVFGRFRAFEERYSSRLQCYCFDKTNVARYGSDVIDFGLCVTILCWLGAVFEPRTSR